MNVVIVTYEHNLLRAAHSPTVPCGHLNGWRGTCDSIQVHMLPGSSRMDAQFLNMTILPKIGDLLGATLRPCIADEKAVDGSGRTGERRQIGVLPRSSDSHNQFMNVVILADIDNLFGTTFRPLVAHQCFHRS